MIPCTDKCVYQKEGICNLALAGANGTRRADGCAYLVEPEKQETGTQRDR